MLSSRDEIAETIRKSGHRVTPQRIIVYEALWRAGSHPSVSDIHEYASKIDPSISLATVYKILQLFTEIGLVREMGFRDGSARYDPDVNFHINLICNECGKIEDYDCISFEEIAPNLNQRAGFQVQSHNFEVRGICSQCRDIR
ncbi:MAG: transcriptional repressor [Candidatus Thorarchaeota archaeon]|nr:transcriptional repressor [Candidatus Thorarchaeota archaeon]